MEREVMTRWAERDVFHRSLRLHETAEPWIFYEGPPTLNGSPGTHHVLSRVFKDIYLRYKTMQGYRVERKPGWDCHGLPVEIAAEADLGLATKAEIEAYGIARFNSKCHASVTANVTAWNELTERIGFWIDLEAPYRTLDSDYIESVWWAIKQIYEQGLLHRGHKVVPHCPRCETTLSSHEVALGYREIVDKSVFARLPLRTARAPLQAGDELVTWTTTTWSLPANAAITANPELRYVRARGQDGHGPVYVLAEERATSVLGPEVEVLDRFSGALLGGLAYEPPFDYIASEEHGVHGHTVLLGEFVTASEGSGLVHTVPAFGEEDYAIGQEHGMKLVNPVRPDGTYDERMGALAGRRIRDSVTTVIEDLQARDRLLRASDYQHSYPHCWRCATPLIHYAKTSWFIATSTVIERLVAANEAVAWTPSHIRDGRFGSWLKNNVDWALSRERYWGTPLPLWECAEGHIHAIGSFEELHRLSGETVIDPHRPTIDAVELPCPQCGGGMQRVPDVIDVWFDSGAMPFAQHHYPFENRHLFEQGYPADFICEAQDQTRGWFYSLLVIGTLLFGRAPYKNALCLGLILDAEGRKMSKSKNNVLEPGPLLDQYGADAVRWYFFTAKQPWDGYHLLPEAITEGVRHFLKPLWRLYSFYALYAQANAPALIAASDGEHGSNGSTGELQPCEQALDAWALSRVAATGETVARHLDEFDAMSAGRAISALVDDLSNWYVRRSRRRFWDGEPQAFETLRACLLSTAKLLAPFCPFIADEIYDNLDGTLASVHLCEFPSTRSLGRRDVALEEQMAIVRTVVRLALKLRADTKINVRQPLAELAVEGECSERDAIERLAGLVEAELNVKSVHGVNGRAGSGTAAAEQACAHDGSLTVTLNLEIDEALYHEGLAREMVRVVQRARKHAQLAVADRIELVIDGDDSLLSAAAAHRRYLMQEALAVTLELGDTSAIGDWTHSETAPIADRTLSVALRRAVRAPGVGDTHRRTTAAPRVKGRSERHKLVGRSHGRGGRLSKSRSDDAAKHERQT
jgi:isoleucyl-tRNA synthetase